MTSTLPAAQQPQWPDPAALAEAVSTLATYPPLVFAGECDVLRTRMASAARGEAFVLQGGDCAETFASATADNIRDRIPELTDREIEVLRLVATGMSYKEIAAELFISHRTVQNHVQNTLGKLHMHNRVELVRFAISRGLETDIRAE